MKDADFITGGLSRRKTACGGDRALVWIGLEKLLVYGLNFAQGVILARLLCPTDFGLAAMLGIFLCVGGTLAESGLVTALIVKGYGPGLAALERSAWWWSMAMASVLYLLFALAAPTVAGWYGAPVLAPLMWTMAAGLVLNAASVVATARLWRTRSFGRLLVVNALGTFVGAALAVVLAAVGFGVWAIAAMGLVQALVRLLLSLGLSRRRTGPVREGEPSSPKFSELLDYGLRLTASGVLNLGYLESYNLVLGKAFDPATVGLFARGDRWARLAGDVTGDAVGRLALPTLTRAKTVGMREAWRFVRLNALLLWPALVVLGIWAEELVTFVFGVQWSPSASLLRILLIGQFVAPLANVAQNVLRSAGRADVLLRADIVKRTFGFAAMFAGLAFGLTGVCWAKVAADIVGALVDLVCALRVRPSSVPRPDMV